MGTTNSVIAVYDSFNGSNKTISVGKSPLLKSMISLAENGEIQIGKPAGINETIKDVKSSMGEYGKKYMLGDQEYTPVIVSSMVLKELKRAAEREFNGTVEVKDVTITVPAKFNHRQRSNTVQAAKLAGLNVISLINEPTSAALAYVENIKRVETALIYDLGGGTFDASLVTITPKIKGLTLRELKIKTPPVENQIVTVICSDGDVNLGGNDLDNLIVTLALEGNTTVFTEEERREMARLAQQLKEQEKPYVVWHRQGEDETEVIMIEDHFVRASNIVYQRTNSIIKNMLMYHSTLKINKIVLVGGSTKNQFIKSNLKDDFPGIKIYSDINPDECVALGASKNSYITLSTDSDTKFFDVSSDTVGVRVLDSEGLIMDRMIEKGTPLPAKFVKQFYRQRTEQSKITVPVYQGENKNCRFNALLGEVSIDNIPLNLPLTEPLVCTFEMDKNGILVCTIEIAGVKRSVTINSKASPTASMDKEMKKLMNEFDKILQTNDF